MLTIFSTTCSPSESLD